jgi:hypothetical protein
VDFDDEGNINFETILKNIETQLDKFTNKGNKTVVVFDQISTVPINDDELYNWINKLLKLGSDKVFKFIINIK